MPIITARTWQDHQDALARAQEEKKAAEEAQAAAEQELEAVRTTLAAAEAEIQRLAEEGQATDALACAAEARVRDLQDELTEALRELTQTITEVEQLREEQEGLAQRRARAAGLAAARAVLYRDERGAEAQLAAALAVMPLGAFAAPQVEAGYPANHYRFEFEDDRPLSAHEVQQVLTRRYGMSECEAQQLLALADAADH